MKKLIIALLIICFLFLVSCEKKEEEKKNNIEKTPVEVFDIDGKIEQNPENNQDNEDEINHCNDNNQNSEENSNTESNTDDDSALTFNEEDFKFNITIIKTENNYKKKIAKDNYLELFDFLKDLKYQKYDQCTSCDTPLYKIAYNDIVISIYEYNFFKINDELFELTSGTFDFLSEFEYTDSESSGWLPWI